ncbi:MAG: acyl-[acyl-carrier-protein] thioesterase [Streptococcaceae bacterium]|jgi:medium-chain acyl-[acyl-carrier-protein] hydrolase|nr:acyl-[acyl-carrier-protein] thioesterase [Streptococcaceae bacterium]
MSKHYTTNYNVPFYQSDATQHMALSALLAVALQVSGMQSIELSRSDDWIREHYGLAWIVTDYAIQVTRLPRFKETVTIETEAASYNKLFCYRDFWYKDSEGQILVTIHSSWVLMSLESRKVSRIIEEIVEPFDAHYVKEIPKGHHFESFEAEKSEIHKVRYADIDNNQHVNNAIYLDWAVNPLGFQFLTTHRPQEIYVKYNHEVLAESDVTVGLLQQGLVSLIGINDKDCQVEIHWETVQS